jgi:hypothetical protein
MSCPKLTAINLSELHQITYVSVEALIGSQLQSIDFHDSFKYQLGSELFSALGRLFKSLTKIVHINIRSAPGIYQSTITFVEKLPEQFKHLVGIALNNSDSTLVDDNNIQLLCSLCPQIEVLDVDYLTCITPIAFVHIGKHLKFLRELSCYGLSDSDLIVGILAKYMYACSTVDFHQMKFVGQVRQPFQAVPLNSFLALSLSDRMSFQTRRVTSDSWKTNSSWGEYKRKILLRLSAN